jgi:hypothetical protein
VVLTADTPYLEVEISTEMAMLICWLAARKHPSIRVAGEAQESLTFYSASLETNPPSL